MADLNTIGGLHYEIMRRCYNEKSVMYKDYGAKGILVCDEWHDRNNFRKWCNENGYEKGLRIERIDRNGNYEPSNCILGTKCKFDYNSGHQKQKRYHELVLSKKEESGIVGKVSKDRLYRTYISMHTRCENKNHKYYKHYGGRGISVCDEWSGKFGFFNFKTWANKSGWKDGLTLDRIDNNKGYSPDNCRWATEEEQKNNRRNTIILEYNGRKATLTEISKLENIKYQLLYNRIIIKGISVYDAINELKK